MSEPTIHLQADPGADPAAGRAGGPAAAAVAWLRAEIDAGASEVPLPGTGRTLERWRYLAGVAARDLVRARLVEGHLDAVAILHELGRGDLAEPATAHAVWATDPADVVATRTDGRWHLAGVKRYCSGSVAIGAALVTATAADGPRLFHLEPSDVARLVVEPGSWPSVGMAASASHTLRLDLDLDDAAGVGGPGAYVQRRGFWAGGAGVASCWLGGAVALVDRLAADPIVLDDRASARAVGTVRAQLAAAAALARRAARDVDDPSVPTDAVRVAAQGLRVAVGHAARSALALANEVGGTRLLCLDADHGRRVADLGAYLSQLGADTAAEYAMATDTVTL